MGRQFGIFAYSLFSGHSWKRGYNLWRMVSLAQRLPNPEYSNTRRVESLVLLLALACLLVTRAWPALSFKAMAMMPMQAHMTADTTPVSDMAEPQPHHNCFDDAFRCMGMMGGLCPLAQANCVPAFAPHLFVPQTHSPVRSLDVAESSLWPNVPKQPPRL